MIVALVFCLQCFFSCVPVGEECHSLTMYVLLIVMYCSQMLDALNAPSALYRIGVSPSLVCDKGKSNMHRSSVASEQVRGRGRGGRRGELLL